MKKIKKSTIILIIIMLIYTIISFINLGDTNAPQTYKNLKNDEVAFLHLSKESRIKKVNVFTGNYASNIEIHLISSSSTKNSSPSNTSNNTEDNSLTTNNTSNNAKNNSLTINNTNNAENYSLSTPTEYIINTESLNNNVFQWFEFNIDSDDPFSFILIKSHNDYNAIGEIAAFDENNNQINIESYADTNKSLIDEQNLVPYTSSYMNSTYFDEIYHVRTAYEQLHNLPIYETTHPPLGKILISIPMFLFGVTPFSYRLMGNIAGILMILVMYFIGKTLFKKEKYGLIAAIIMSLDGMHFTQTRIATVDSFLVLFSMLSFLFMIKYMYITDNTLNKKKLLNLCLSGIFIGLAIATKWVAFFVALGLAIIFFMHLIYQIVKYKKNKRNSNKQNKRDLEVSSPLIRELIKLLLYCILFFVIIPICIYIASYIPLFLNPECSIKDIPSFIEYQKRMFEYHSLLQDGHPFASAWYTWPISYTPVWYYNYHYSDDIASTIACMSNPLISWFGIATTIFSIIYSIIKRDKEIIPVIVLIATTWLSYIFISRIMFLYHYFTTLPFVMLTIVYFIKVLDNILKRKVVRNIIIALILIIFIIGFIYFYPIFSGYKVSTDYIEQTQWLSHWIY